MLQFPRTENQLSVVASTDDVIVTTLAGVTILGGGDVTLKTLELALSLAPVLLAADGGAETALALGRTPRAVIGDMDSISDAVRNALPDETFHRIGEQDSTDLDKCVRSIEAPICVAIGVSGPRMDHGLAALNVVARNPGRSIVLLTEEEMCFLCPPKIRMTVPVGCRVSLFPISPVTVSSSGLKWELDQLELAPAGRIGTSNEARITQVKLSADNPGLLVILPAIQFGAMVAILRNADDW